MSIITIEALAERFDRYARIYYRKPSGKPTNTRNNIQNATRTLCQCRLQTEHWSFRVGTLNVHSMSLAVLRAVQQSLDASMMLSRIEINDRLKWVRTMFRWAADQGLAPTTLPAELDGLKPLKKGRCNAPESPGVKPVSWETVSATIAVAPLRIATMIEVQWHTGMRPCELVLMRWSCIDTSCNPWLYRPPESKCEHLGIERVIAIGPLAQGLLNCWRSRSKGDALWPMDRMNYSQSVRRLNDRHGLTRWQPRQIRHSTATRIRKEHGIEAARAVLGHTSIKTTEIYAEADTEAAMAAVRDFG